MGISAIVATAAGTTGQVLIGSTGADPAFGALGVNSNLTAHSLVLAEGNSAFVALGAATNGQIPIGSTGNDPVLSTITAGTGISISGSFPNQTVTNSSPGTTYTAREPRRARSNPASPARSSRSPWGPRSCKPRRRPRASSSTRTRSIVVPSEPQRQSHIRPSGLGNTATFRDAARLG